MAGFGQRSTLLNAVGVTGPGNSSSMGEAYSTFTFMKTVTGVFTVLVVNYEGSLDGVNWFQLGTDNTLVAGPTFVVDKPCLFVRGNVATFTGGTSVSVDFVPMRP